MSENTLQHINIAFIAIFYSSNYNKKQNKMSWIVTFTKNTIKQQAKLPKNVRLVTQLLIEDLKYKGPAPGKEWPNYGKLNGKKNKDQRHCHLIKGRPTYIACWEVLDHNEKLIEVYYVGTHEKAPY